MLALPSPVSKTPCIPFCVTDRSQAGATVHSDVKTSILITNHKIEVQGQQVESIRPKSSLDVVLRWHADAACGALQIFFKVYSFHQCLSFVIIPHCEFFLAHVTTVLFYHVCADYLFELPVACLKHQS